MFKKLKHKSSVMKQAKSMNESASAMQLAEMLILERSLALKAPKLQKRELASMKAIETFVTMSNNSPDFGDCVAQWGDTLATMRSSLEQSLDEASDYCDRRTESYAIIQDMLTRAHESEKLKKKLAAAEKTVEKANKESERETATDNRENIQKDVEDDEREFTPYMTEKLQEALLLRQHALVAYHEQQLQRHEQLFETCQTLLGPEDMPDLPALMAQARLAAREKKGFYTKYDKAAAATTAQAKRASQSSSSSSSSSSAAAAAAASSDDDDGGDDVAAAEPIDYAALARAQQREAEEMEECERSALAAGITIHKPSGGASEDTSSEETSSDDDSD
jgi:hypothetical protein